MSDQKSRAPLGILLIVGGLLLIGALIRGGVVRLSGHPVLGAERVSLQIAKDATPVPLSNFTNGFASVLDPALPAVVNISSTSIVKVQPNVPSFLNDPFFRQFFGGQSGQQSPSPETERQYSLGSGVIVNPDGYIMTNNHVVANASDVEVFTQDRKKYKAQVIGTDPRTDIAVLRIPASGLPTLTLDDSSKLKVGDLVFAIGDPFGVGETATTGIVSATGRALGGAIEQYEDFIQTDAAINPGNSGGALIDLRGNLVGINTAILAGNGGGNEGIGFAIPIDEARDVMEQIVAHGKVVRGYLGVGIQGVTPDIAKAFGLSQGGGALVSDVAPNSPAALAGIQRGDIVTELNGQPVSGPDELSVRISQIVPGEVAHLGIIRNGKKLTLDATLGQEPENSQGSQPPKQPGAVLRGLQLENLTSALAQQLDLPSSTTGVVVTGVDPSSPAATAGIQNGDVILEANRQPVHNLNEFQRALAAIGNQPVLLLVDRQGTTVFVLVQRE